MTDFAAMKQQARATWAAGDFDAVVPFIWEAGTAAADASQCGPGDRVLDVAAGSGNAAIQVAMRGADVVASDLTPELFEPGRRRAAEHGVELEWVEADAEDLPFETASFDAAVSTFGIMFAPRQSLAAAELARVVKPGGRIALCSWRPAGFVGEMFRTIASFMNPPPPPEGPPVRWGTEEGAHELLDDTFEIGCEERTLFQRYDGPVDEMTDYFMDRFGPMVMARRALEPAGRWDEFLEVYRELTRRWDQGEADSAALPASYLLVTGTRRA
ncbi:MAG TPA: methyltransferase domain-containing protein [Conexibacter sp.]|nr:methyltransferase domain-containing protein [Conexibacter sp.]